jgi:hypothetical protein
MASQDTFHHKDEFTNGPNISLDEGDSTLEQLELMDKKDLKDMQTNFNQTFKPTTPQKVHLKTGVLLISWEQSNLPNLQNEVSMVL